MQKYNKIIQEIANFDDVTKENIKQHNPNQSQIPDHPYIILVIGVSEFGNIDLSFNLRSLQSDINKIDLYTKKTCEKNIDY